VTRLRDLGLRIGSLEPGPRNTITDVRGVSVGHITVRREESPPPAGRGVARTGVTAVVPAPPETLVARPLNAGTAVLNGAGELTGSIQIREWGRIETPIYLTSTMAVGRVYDGAVAAAVAADASVGTENFVIPIVGECDDGWLNDARTVQVEAVDVSRALGAAGAEVAEGAVGAGTGMIAFGWKGGIGTSSRVVDGGTVGVLVLANYGSARQLRIDGVPVGELLGPPPPGRESPAGSCIGIVATDAPLGTHTLSRLARRVGLGLARTGSVGHDGSGEIFAAVSTTPGDEEHVDVNAFFTAVVDATEEAVVNTLWAAEDTEGREGRLIRALPHEPVLELLRAAGRLGD
jgi:D-aminopeptidase